MIIGYLESEKIGSLKINTGYLIFSLKKPVIIVVDCGYVKNAV